MLIEFPGSTLHLNGPALRLHNGSTHEARLQSVHDRPVRVHRPIQDELLHLPPARVAGASLSTRRR